MKSNPLFKIIVLLLMLLVLVSGCSPAGTAGAQKSGGSSESQQDTAAMQPLPVTATVESPNTERTYTGTFEIRFDGDNSWIYQLQTRNAGGLMEISLHIEGVSSKDNPGDIRLVTDGTTSWMRGAGTDKACIQFPNHQGLDPSFIVPGTLFPLQSIDSQLGSGVDEDVSGKKTLHFSGDGLDLGAWKDAAVNVWQDASSNDLVQFTMQASGNDPFFGAGKGKLSAVYQTVDKVDGDIKPVKGCEVDLPMPKNMEGFVRLPDMASFESTRSPDSMVSFYQKNLPPAGWAELEPLSQEDGKSVMSYSRDGQEVDIQITPRDDGGSKVKLLFVSE